MTVHTPTTEPTTETPPTAQTPPPAPKFILYLQGPEYGQTLRKLTLWVHHVLLPVYGREVTSSAPWCSRWWEHPEAVAQLHALWLAWGELTDTGSPAGPTGPAAWHRDYLSSVMQNLRDPSGPFAGCKAGTHRPKQVPTVDIADPFGQRPLPPDPARPTPKGPSPLPPGRRRFTRPAAPPPISASKPPATRTRTDRAEAPR